MTSQQKSIPEKILSRPPSGDSRDTRFGRLVDLFKRSHDGLEPNCIIRSPGRVNLIGDHVDYHGFPVLPMAIENCIWLVCHFEASSSCENVDHEASLELKNTDSATYPSWTGAQTLTHAADLDKTHRWQNYVLCGYHGVVATDLLGISADQVLENAKQLCEDKQLLANSRKCLGGVADCKILIDSDLPAASGLSSSSALVCGSALATSLLLRRSKLVKDDAIDSIRLANNCSKYEHLVGTRGGGMDQAVIVTAQEGFAKYVEFQPELWCQNVRLPEGIVWLVSHCGVNYPKASTTGFNSRVLETKVGAALIARAKETSRPSPIKLDWTISLAQVREEFYNEQSLQEMVHDIRNNVFGGRKSFSLGEVCERLGLTRDQLAERFPSHELKDELQLLSRCEHVLEEADRVAQFRSVCDSTVDVVRLGHLMTQSHYSLRDKFECSHQALDRLVDVALEAGALGSRLTGAGWGGCIVSLVEASKRDTVTKRLREVSKFTFETEPRSGCEVFWLED